MLTAEAQFVICANCGEWAWNGTYKIGLMIVLDDFLEQPGAFCICCIREKANRENIWFDPSWFEDSSKFLIDRNLICKN